jgi:hypothetical protein
MLKHTSKCVRIEFFRCLRKYRRFSETLSKFSDIAGYEIIVHYFPYLPHPRKMMITGKYLCSKSKGLTKLSVDLISNFNSAKFS